MKVASVWEKSKADKLQKYLKIGYFKNECVMTAYVIKFKGNQYWNWCLLGVDNGRSLSKRGKTSSKEEAFMFADNLFKNLGFKLLKNNGLLMFM